MSLFWHARIIKIPDQTEISVFLVALNRALLSSESLPESVHAKRTADKLVESFRYVGFRDEDCEFFTLA